MKVINSKLAAIGLAAFVFASCSSNDATENGGSGDSNINVSEAVEATLTSSSTAAQLAARVANYKNTTANARKYFFSRAADYSTNDKVVIPDMPDNILNLKSASDLVSGKTYKISGKTTIDFGDKSIAGATIYIKGGSTMKYNGNADGCKIYVDAGGVLEYTGSDVMVPANATIICDEGSIKSTNDIEVAGKLYVKYPNAGSGLGATEAYDKTDAKAIIKPTQNITFLKGADAYFDGSLHAVKLDIQQGATVYATKHIMNATEVEVDGALKFDGFLRTATLTVKGELIASENSSIKATKELNAESGSHIVADYINVCDSNERTSGTLNLKGDCKININNKSDIYTYSIVTDNASAGQITLDNDNAIAVIKTKKFVNNSDNQIQALATSGNNATFLLQFTECYTKSTKENSFEDLDIAASYLDYDKATDGKGVTVKEKSNDGTCKAYGYEWSGDPATIIASPKLDLIAADNTPSDGQSATCIQAANNGSNKLYVSYHTNGTASNGNLEVFHMEGTNLKIDQSVETKNNTNDYNHILADGNTLWLAGAQSGTKDKTDNVTGIGAFLGKITLQADGSIKEGDKVQFYALDKTVRGQDANCVANYSNHHFLATTKGFSVFDKNMNFWNNNGTEGKYVVTANNKLYALQLDGTLSVYENADIEKPTATYQVGAITPKTNKAVVAVDEANGDIYVCKGENGISKISNGVVSQFFDCPTFTAAASADKVGKVKGHANGIAIGSQYIYVACGSYGLVVLDRTTGKEICHRKAYNGKSANFVAFDNSTDYIYVAYGQSRIQVFNVATTK